jgi:hypothetical protein
MGATIVRERATAEYHHQNRKTILLSGVTNDLLFELLECAYANDRDNPKWELIQNYWTLERPALASKTHETIDADFTAMFDPLPAARSASSLGAGVT